MFNNKFMAHLKFSSSTLTARFSSFCLALVIMTSVFLGHPVSAKAELIAPMRSPIDTNSVFLLADAEVDPAAAVESPAIVEPDSPEAKAAAKLEAKKAKAAAKLEAKKLKEAAEAEAAELKAAEKAEKKAAKLEAKKLKEAAKLEAKKAKEAEKAAAKEAVEEAPEAPVEAEPAN